MCLKTNKGSAFTYFASESKVPYEVHVFEKSDRVGGRIKHFDFNNQSLEIGASILYSGLFHYLWFHHFYVCMYVVL